MTDCLLLLSTLSAFPVLPTTICSRKAGLKMPVPEGTLGLARPGELSETATFFWMLKHSLLVFPGPPAGAIPCLCCGVNNLFNMPKGGGGLVNLLLLPKSILLNLAPSGVASTAPCPARGVDGIDPNAATDLLGT